MVEKKRDVKIVAGAPVLRDEFFPLRHASSPNCASHQYPDRPKFVGPGHAASWRVHFGGQQL